MSGKINMVCKSGVYKIECIINNKIYIGSSKNIHRRFLEHKSDLKLNKHSNRYLQQDYNLYGSSNFKFEILCRCDLDKLLEIEQQYIDYYGGLDSDLTYNLFSVDFKDRSYMAIDNSGKSNPMYGHKHTEYTKHLISKHNAMNNPNIRKKVSESLRGKSKYQDNISLYRVEYLKSGNIREVADKFGINKATMYYLIKYGCCNKQQHLKYPDTYFNWLDTLDYVTINELQNKQIKLRKEISKKSKYNKN